MAYYAQLSCEFTRDPRMIAAGWQARAVYVEAMLYCRENLTDGLIDRLALIFWMPDMPVKTRTRWLETLVSVNALDRCEQGWRFPTHVWNKWNPLKADVEAKREAEAQRKADYRARRRAESQGSPEDVPTGQRVTATSRPRQTEREGERETELVLVPKPRERNLVWDALVEHVGDVTTKSEQSRRAKVVSELKAAKATPEQIAARCREYQNRWPKMSLTDTALAKHWSALEADALPPKPTNNGVTMSRYA